MASSSRLLPTLLVDPALLAPTAIVVGDANRARDLADRLEDASEVGANREYVTWVGRAGDHPVTVCAHGVGAAGANVCFVELIEGGVRTLIRAGTCGAVQTGISDGDLIIASAAVREDGVSDHLIPTAYPAVPDRTLTTALAATAVAHGVPFREGLVVTEANFYPGSEPPRWQRYAPYGALVVEMEMSSLFVVAAMRGARAAGILAVDGNLVDARDPDMSDYDPHREVVKAGVGRMLDIVVDTVQSTEVS